jgi:hypothetical protein
MFRGIGDDDSCELPYEERNLPTFVGMALGGLLEMRFYVKVRPTGNKKYELKYHLVEYRKYLVHQSRRIVLMYRICPEHLIYRQLR